MEIVAQIGILLFILLLVLLIKIIEKRKNKYVYNRYVFSDCNGKIAKKITPLLAGIFLFIFLFFIKRTFLNTLLFISIVVLIAIQISVVCYSQLIIDSKGIRVRLYRKESWDNIENWYFDKTKRIIYFSLKNGKKREFGKLSYENIDKIDEILELMKKKKQ